MIATVTPASPLNVLRTTACRPPDAFSSGCFYEPGVYGYFCRASSIFYCLIYGWFRFLYCVATCTKRHSLYILYLMKVRSHLNLTCTATFSHRHHHHPMLLHLQMKTLVCVRMKRHLVKSSIAVQDDLIHTYHWINPHRPHMSWLRVNKLRVCVKACVCDVIMPVQLCEQEAEPLWWATAHLQWFGATV